MTLQCLYVRSHPLGELFLLSWERLSSLPGQSCHRQSRYRWQPSTFNYPIECATRNRSRRKNRTYKILSPPFFLSLFLLLQFLVTMLLISSANRQLQIRRKKSFAGRWMVCGVARRETVCRPNVLAICWTEIQKRNLALNLRLVEFTLHDKSIWWESLPPNRWKTIFHTVKSPVSIEVYELGESAQGQSLRFIEHTKNIIRSKYNNLLQLFVLINLLLPRTRDQEINIH